MTWAYLQTVAAQNVVHTEMFFDPQVSKLLLCRLHGNQSRAGVLCYARRTFNCVGTRIGVCAACKFLTRGTQGIKPKSKCLFHL